MDLRQYLGVLRERWKFVIACVLVAVLAAGSYTASQKPLYSASTQLFVSVSGDTTRDASSAYQGGLFGAERVKSYADIVSSQPVVQRVKDELHLPDPVGALQGEIAATAPLDTVLLDVTVTDASPVRAAAIASSVGREFAARVNELETPQGEKVSPVKVSIAQPPSVPSAPVSPRTKLNLALGLLVGLAVGIGGAVLRSALDTRIRDQETVSAILDGPVLGGFRDESAVREHPLLVDSDPFSHRAESFRQLRTNIRFLAVDTRVRSLVVTSSLPAEGKTTVSTNLAIALAQSGEQVILVDADLRRPAIGELMGLNPRVGLTNVLLETTSVDSALQTYRDGLSLRVLTSGPIPPNPSELLGSQRMQDVLAALQQRATVVIFDTPPLLPVTDAAVLAVHTDGALLVARAGATHRDQLRTSVTNLQQVGAHLFGAVVNRLPARRAAGGYGYGYSYNYQPKNGAGAVEPAAGRGEPVEKSLS